MYTTTQFQATPDQLAEYLAEKMRGIVREELAKYTPPAPEGEGLPKLMTRQEVKDYLRVSLNTIDNWAKDTDVRPALLVPQVVNSRIRYRREDVLTFQKEHRRFQKAIAEPEAPAQPTRRRGRPALSQKDV